MTPDEMQTADRAAIESGIPSFDLMKAAGRAVAEAARRMMGGTYGRRTLVLAGKGNNGGDGLVAGGILARTGTAVKVLMTGDPGALRGDARTALESFVEASGRAGLGALTPDAVKRELERSDLILDALVGTGFRGALGGAAAEATELVNRSGGRVLSVDIPSGVDGATGWVEGAAIRAERTVTLAALKPGLVLHPGVDYAGDVEIAGIGIQEEQMSSAMHLAEPGDVAALLPPRGARAHKRSVGKVLIVAGSPGMSGAAVLAASAALRTGAGLVWVAAPRSIAGLIEQSVTEAVVAALPDTADGEIAASAAERVLELAEKADAVALGPGITTREETKDFVFRVVAGTGRPVILDADGINAFTGDGGRLAFRRAPTVLTPHAGELAGLLGSDVKTIETSPVQSVREAARVTGSTVLLKGHPTLVAQGDTVVAVTPGGPVLATAGTGDVLTGVIAALAAARPTDEAAWAGAWLHGSAGRLASLRLVQGGLLQLPDRGLIASDLLGTLPEAIARARSAAG